ncbi:MAG TPA: 4-hydroxy-tetrahydrodipicolinate reductase, partial [Bacteroidales bacterium]|nr:4-hydroxy-tetrahydrodipicolinate reductase [Bacteroidales bacterium]
MKIALIGYGRMGKLIEKMALTRGHEIVAKLDNERDWRDQLDQFVKADVAIEFSLPDKV